MNKYNIKYSESIPILNCDFEGPKWDEAELIELKYVRPESVNPLPKTSVKLLWGEDGINGIFKVEDHSLLARYTNIHEPVWRDSCVEFFVKPKGVRGYINFEFNCIGTLLCSHVTNHERTTDGFRESRRIEKEDCQSVLRMSSINEPVPVEVTAEKEWYLEFFIPFELLRKYFGDITINPGDEWTSNFYKCGDDLINPHWIAWSEVKELNFHSPEDFGKIVFGK